ncbi:unnamed protein product [Leptidea sinapis]|uniref:Uncharacterized protein n=1 Tax=Leptidea sinapis TaxID=189913 RepID=A0A5E4R193_9NEOP|nr:unnamed protein product [Leptidea sinapis]
MIELNYDANLRHPYIYVPDINGKFMLDTGSTRSFISPEKAEAYFADAKQYEPFTVTSTHASSVHHEVANIPLFSIFNDSGYHKFYIYNVDHRYDGLIGMDLMSRLSADICLKDKTLKTNSAYIYIVYNTDYELLLDPRVRYRPIEQPCQEITAKEYLCSENKLVQYAEETCIKQLMKYHHNLSRCSSRQVESENLKIERIAPNSWIV